MGEVIVCEPETVTSSLGLGLSGFCVWQWVESDQKWIKKKEYAAKGYQPGIGPTDPGRYDGQIVRWMCITITE
jgi:hypothetical protein